MPTGRGCAVRESNPRDLLGKQTCCHYTNSAEEAAGFEPATYRVATDGSTAELRFRGSLGCFTSVRGWTRWTANRQENDCCPQIYGQVPLVGGLINPSRPDVVDDGLAIDQRLISMVDFLAGLARKRRSLQAY